MRIRRGGVQLEAIDLCAGAGGLSLGLRRAGFRVSGVELDGDACKTHRANVGECEQASIVEWRPPKRAALVAGGVPCQGYSVAGKRQGSDLWQSWLRVAVEAQADAVLLENVRGMLSWRYPDDALSVESGQLVIDRIKSELRAWGYAAQSAILCAADYGTPQLRYRLILVAFRDPKALAAFRWPEPTHAEVPESSGLKSWVTVRQALGLGGGEYRSGLKEGASPASPQGMRFLNVDRPAPVVATVGELLGVLDRPLTTVSAGGKGGGGGAEPFANADYRRKLGEALSRVDRPAPVIKENSGRAGRGARASQRPVPDLAHQLGEAGLLERPATTVSTEPLLSIAGHHVRQQRGAVRLSLEHRAILQGFPLGFIFHGATAWSRDKQAGNAVPPQLGEAVGRSIIAALTAAEGI